MEKRNQGIRRFLVGLKPAVKDFPFVLFVYFVDKVFFAVVEV
jgi:hypothetical protein